MARTPYLVTAAALLLPYANVQAQDAGGQPSAAPSPTPTSRPIERVQGVPNDFTLQPQADTVRRNRTEPTIQPLPQPSASPRQSVATPTPTPTPTSTATQPAPVATPTPRVALPIQEREEPASRPSPPVQRPADSEAGEIDGGSEMQADAPAPLPAENTSGGPLPDLSLQIDEPESVASDEGNSSTGWLMWLVLGLLAAAAVGAGVWWFLRRKAEVGVTVEKIEPYRPPAAAPATEPRQPRPEPETAQAPPASKPSGLVHASRPAAQANPGGFVTSTISARSRPAGAQQAPQGPEGTQSPRRYTSADGRIVTSLSPTRRQGD